MSFADLQIIELYTYNNIAFYPVKQWTTQKKNREYRNAADQITHLVRYFFFCSLIKSQAVLYYDDDVICRATIEKKLHKMNHLRSFEKKYIEIPFIIIA